MSPVKSRLSGIAALLSLLFVLNNLSGEAQTRKAFTDSNSSLTLVQRIDVFEDTWQTIYERYYDLRFNGIDWKSAHDHYLPLVEQAANNDEFYRQLKAMVSG